MCRQRLDARDRFPKDIEEYLSKNGWSFSKGMYEWAVSKMKTATGSKLTPIGPTMLKEMLRKNNVNIEKDNGYDACYVFMMFKADYGDIITNETILLRMLKAYIDDPDGYDGLPFTRFYADIIGSGANPPWEELV